MPKIITYFLQPYYSKADAGGNVYWAFEMRDAETGLEIHGYISGGESNIDGIIYGFSTPKEFDRTIVRLKEQQVGIREMNKIQKTWPYAGCASDDIRKFIREQFGKE
jgi:hypothetical protein